MIKNKKVLVFSGLIALCVILAAGVFMLSQSPKSGDNLSSAGEIVQNITPIGIGSGADIKNINIKPDPIPLSERPDMEQNGNDIPLTVIEDKPEPPDKPDMAHNGNGDEPQEKVTDIALTDPKNKPDSAPKPAEAKTTKVTTPNTGDKKDGQIFIPGFGWVVDEGGGGQGSSSYVDESKLDNIIGK